MKTARWLVFCLVAGMAAAPGSTGCSCKDNNATVAADLNLLASPSDLPFGTVAIGGQKSLTVTLTHVGGTGTIQFADVYLDGLSDEFTLTQPDKMSLQPGESVDITVTYTPTTSASADGDLVITHNVANQGNVTRIPVTALAQVGELFADPNPIDFGDVPVGDDKTLDVTLTNQGTDAIIVNQIYLRLDGSTDFTIEDYGLSEGQTLPITLAPGTTHGLVMKYKPAGGGEDRSTLVIEGTTQDQFQAWSFDVTGNELGPHLVASPGQIDFHWVPLNTEATALLEVKNEGNSDLTIPAAPVGLNLWMGSDPHITFKDDLSSDVVIKPGKTHDFTIGWTPTEVLPDDGTPIGQLMINSNDLSQSPMPIPVFGRADAPILVVIPDAVDLNFGAQMTPVERQVTLRNDGHGQLDIASATLVDISDTQYGNEFQLIHGTDKSQAIGAFSITGSGTGTNSDVLSVEFTNKGPDKGTVNATLRIVSNDVAHPTLDIPVTVQRSGAPVCNIAIVPMSVNFGTVAIGFPVDKPVNLVNIGTGYCSFKNAVITDCSTSMFGGAICNDPFKGAASKIFLLKNLPPVAANGLKPGSTTTMTVQFIPPSGGGSIFQLLNQYDGLLSVKVHDEVLQKDIVLPKGAGDPATYTANVTGASGIAKISVLPGKVDFGVTTIGCYSKTYKICIYNSGNAPLTVNDVALKGCTPEFKVKDIPKLPMNVPNGAPKCIQAVYAPQDEGPDNCVLQISATDKESPTVAVILDGEGTYDTHQVDEFTQVTGQEVDILFIIDDSGSMSEEQDRLTASFSDFIAQASVWNNDFHLGGISVNVVDEKVIGRLNRGDVTVQPRFMTKANNNAATFAKMVDYGSNGGSDAQESGFQPAQTALSAPLSTDTGIACSTDTDCSTDPNICPSGTGCGYTCIEGTCGGFNSRFLRDDAQLEMIALSDEEDQSSGSLPEYIDFFKNIKGWYNVDMMHFNAIVGAVNGVASDCTASDGGTGAAGHRYVEVVNETGGKVGSICADSYAPIMNDIGNVTFHPKVQFFLSRLADPATVSVKVNSKACGSGWRYDAPSNSIVFDLNGTCMPGPGDKIHVEYDTLCLTS